MVDLDRLRAAYEKVRGELLAERTPEGHWVGELSSSALSTATAVSALAVVQGKSTIENSLALAPGLHSAQRLDRLIRRGVAWLVQQQNDDGGFGDTDLSHSNIATTYLVVAALHLAGVASEHGESIRRANAYIESEGGLKGLRKRYGIDKTFVVPIMTNLALAGLVDWSEVDPLPFELACVPQSLYRFVGMPVVSYAIPALVAIGQARYFHLPPGNLLLRLVRRLAIRRSLKVLRRMQPESGGYLEATPLTSFVVMSLAACRPLAPRAETAAPNHRLRSERTAQEIASQVIHAGVKFLIHSIRPDGSWPIDTNLATWNTTLAINALAGAGEDVAALLGEKGVEWLLSCQHTKRHALSGAKSGGFGWSNLSGAVPDADDTAGAVLVLRQLFESRFRNQHEPSAGPGEAGRAASEWLSDLQNRDGGWPTFCRGWGKLPFDRSGTDLTAHALRALVGPQVFGNTWFERPFFFRLSRSGPKLHIRQRAQVRAALRFLKEHQHPDGSWSPLWFGNQDHPHEDNPVYGTAKVIMAYRDLGLMDSPEAQRGVAWLVANQNEDGGWGSGVWRRLQNAQCTMHKRNGAKLDSMTRVESHEELKYSVLRTQHAVLGSGCEYQTNILHPRSHIPFRTSSVEETALAVEALLAAYGASPERRTPNAQPLAAALARGLAWLLECVERNEHRQPAPIGFYFAKLWYYERLYPLIFATAALGRACRQFACLERNPFVRSDAP